MTYFIVMVTFRDRVRVRKDIMSVGILACVENKCVCGEEENNSLGSVVSLQYVHTINCSYVSHTRTGVTVSATSIN